MERRKILHKRIAQAIEDRGIRIEPGVSAPSDDEPGTTSTFENAWNALVLAVKEATSLPHITGKSHTDAWKKHFHPIISKGHRDERDFSASLFGALHASLKEFCQDLPVKAKRGKMELVYTREIRLRNCNVGFATEVYRHENLGLPKNYGMSTSDDIVDHACVIFRALDGTTDTPVATKRQKTSATDSIPIVSFAPEHDDMTAVVVLEAPLTGCKEYYRDDHFHLRDALAITRQALWCTMDSWHCLARRGRAAQSLLVVVLTGRERAGIWKRIFDAITGKSSKSTGTAKAKLCGIKATLSIPQELGDAFTLQIDHCVEFSDENDKDDTDAIAIYLQTLATGVHHANEINKANRCNKMSPTSLCCSGTSDLRLIASPIPDASNLEEMRISQGELFRFRSPNSNLRVDQWLSQFVETEFCCIDPPPAMKDCLIKVSHRTVHDALVTLEGSWKALSKLDFENQSHGDVLLACANISHFCLVTVMRDLSVSAFTTMSCGTFTSGRALWAGFSKLAETALLGLAKLGVVHADIRCEPHDELKEYIVYNVLGRNNANGDVDLRLIDYESLVMLSDMTSRTLQDHAVSTGDFLSGSSNAFHFLSWQILWIAHAWFVNYYRTPASATERVWSGEHVRSLHFVKGLFHDKKRDDRLRDFNRWIDARELKSLEASLKNLPKALIEQWKTKKSTNLASSEAEKALIARQEEERIAQQEEARIRDGSRFIMGTLECLAECFK